MPRETHEFQAQVKQILDLVIHSLYSNKDIFLRELVSNASDAIDRRRFAGVTRPELLPAGEFAIELLADPGARTLCVRDNGIGMSRDELVENLGTIARSGSAEFLAALQRDQGATAPELIGQFGVGFYASFMVAERVEVLTRRAGESGAHRWESSGDGSFSLEEAERDEAGTTITLHLRAVEPEAGLQDYTDEWVLRGIVKRYSDFVAHPIRLRIEGDAPKEIEEDLNSREALWTRPADQVEERELFEFYRHISHDWQDPLLPVRTKIEGTFEARALLFVPQVAPPDLYHREMAHKGIQLYVKRVFIMDECRELMPEFLRFVKGVVDAEDLSLNVSREMLQQDRQIRAIRRHLVKKVLDALGELAENDADAYRRFWAAFGPVLKEGLLVPDEKPERILDLVRCHSTHASGELTSLAQVVERMGDDQTCFYYAVGESLAALESSPHLEAFRDKGIEVLLFADPVDEIWLAQLPPEYRGKSWRSVGQGEVELGDESEREAAAKAREEQADALKGVLAAVRAAVQEDVKEVRVSSRLTTSPACLVLEQGDMTPQMEEMLRRAGQDVPKTKRVLEVNPQHALVERLSALHAADAEDARVTALAELLYGQAVLAEGGRPEDAAAFVSRLNELLLAGLEPGS
ncbi:MAG: molecular chaperone HtpG [Proteobacteria bacterium]|nr:molecular chaperone HtpG [Pseudomonadota bacterium]